MGMKADVDAEEGGLGDWLFFVHSEVKNLKVRRFWK